MKMLGLSSACCWLALMSLSAAQSPSACPRPTRHCPYPAQVAEPVRPRDYPFPHEPQLPPPPPQPLFDVFEEDDLDVFIDVDEDLPQADRPLHKHHLLKAAHHLEAAGLKEHAMVLRRMAKKEHLSPHLVRKLKQLKALQAEVKRLRRQNGVVNKTQQVMLEVQVLELSLTKLRKLGIGFNVAKIVGRVTQRQGHHKQRFFHCNILGPKVKTHELIKSLRKADAVKVIASPTLVTISGRPARYLSGGEFPVVVPQDPGETSVEFKEFGTSLEFVPIILENGHLRLEVRHRVSTIDRTRTVTVGRHTVPGLSVHEMDAGFELRFGQTLVMARATETKRSNIRQTSCTRRTNKQEQTQTLVLITPRRVDAKLPAKQMDKPKGPLAERPDESWWKFFFIR